MAHESTVLEIMEVLKVADDKIIGEIMASKGIWSEGQSTRTNSLKSLKTLADLRKIERCNGFFRTLDCKSDYKDHAKLLTKALAEILKLNFPVKIYREITIPEKGLRSDAICLITKDNHGLCFVLEVIHNETQEYFKQKLTTWKTWNEATQYLSKLFGYKIPCFSVITAGQRMFDVLTLDDLLEEVRK